MGYEVTPRAQLPLAGTCGNWYVSVISFRTMFSQGISHDRLPSYRTMPLDCTV